MRNERMEQQIKTHFDGHQSRSVTKINVYKSITQIKTEEN